MKTETTFTDAINWEYVHAHHPLENGKVKPGAWCQRIITHARERGFTGRITEIGACRIINANLY
jgi:hypothetical protein